MAAPQVDTTAEKRKVLVETFLMCLGRSKVREVVDLDTIGSVLQSAMGELWRGGEFRLEVPWKILTREPGLTEDDVKSPLLVFKTYENDLGVRVRLPEVLGEVSEDELASARAAAGLTQEDFAKVVERLREIEADEARRRDALRAATEAQGTAAPAVVLPKKPKPWLRIGLTAGLLSLAGGFLFFALRQPDTPFDVSDVSSILQLQDARRQDKTLAARIADPKWEVATREQKTQMVKQVFEQERGKGIDVVTLSDGTRPAAMAVEIAGALSVEIF